MIRRHTLFLVFLLVGLIGLSISFSLYRKQHSPNNSSNAPLESSSKETSSGAFTDSSIHSSSQSPSRLSNRTKVTIASASLSASPSIPDSKLESIAELYDSLTLADYDHKGPHPKEIEILIEGMDTLRAAKYLKTLRLFDSAFEYAERALAENPGSFEALLLRTKLLPSDREAEREAGLRQLLEMHPSSVEVLAGLGGMLSTSRPYEAIQYLQKAVAVDPSNSGAYVELGYSYEKLGQYDKALSAFQKAFQIYPGQVAGAHIRAIKEGNPIIKPIQQKPQRQLTEETVPEGGPSEVPLQENVPPVPDTPSGLERGTGFDNEPGDFTLPRENSEASTAEQQAIEELIQIIEDYEASISNQSTPSAVVEGQITDLERSIEERPNQAESYLKLARAYQEAGEDEKAAEIYRRAREHFPDNEEVRQESETYRDKRRRSTQRGGEDEGDSYSDKDSSEENERR